MTRKLRIVLAVMCGFWVMACLSWPLSAVAIILWSQLHFGSDQFALDSSDIGFSAAAALPIVVALGLAGFGGAALIGWVVGTSGRRYAMLTVFLCSATTLLGSVVAQGFDGIASTVRIGLAVCLVLLPVGWVGGLAGERLSGPPRPRTIAKVVLCLSIVCGVAMTLLLRSAA